MKVVNPWDFLCGLELSGELRPIVVVQGDVLESH